MTYVGGFLLFVLLSVLHASNGTDTVRILPASKKVHVKAGGSVTLECSSKEGVTVYWSHQGMEVSRMNKPNTYTEKISAGHTPDGRVLHELHIKNIGNAENGEYQCKNQANPLEMDTGKITVTRDEALKLTATKSSDEGVSLACIGKNDVDIEWYYNGELIEENEPEIMITLKTSSVENTKESHLRHENPDPKIDWSYFCRDKNSKMADSDPFEILRTNTDASKDGHSAGFVAILSPWLLAIVCITSIIRNTRN